MSKAGGLLTRAFAAARSPGAYEGRSPTPTGLLTSDGFSADKVLAEVLETHDLVSAELGNSEHLPYMIVAERDPRRNGRERYIGQHMTEAASANGLVERGVSTELAARNTQAPGMSELGSSSPSPWTSWLRGEYNPELQGIRGLEKYDQMRRNDGTVRGSLRVVKTPVLSARWFVEPASNSARDKNAADFLWWNLTEAMTYPFEQFIWESLLSLDFGYYMFEKVWQFDVWKGREVLRWKKMGPRHPMDVQEWILDGNGGPVQVIMNPTAESDTSVYGNGVPINIDKLLVFTFDKEGGNMEGISVLRSAYKHWYYKEQLYKIDAIQKERHGIGIPVIKLPVNPSENDKLLADEMGRNIRTNERAHIVLLPGWDVFFAKVEGNPVNAMESIEHHDRMIRANVLAPFSGEEFHEEDQIMFLKADRFIADLITGVINKFAVKQLIDFNYARVGYPRIRTRRIGETADWRTLSFGVRNLVGSGVIRPDDRLEEVMRDEMDLPAADPSTARITQTPQNPSAQGPQPEPPKPPRVGPPRQKTQPPVGPPRGNAGGDRSGG